MFACCCYSKTVVFSPQTSADKRREQTADDDDEPENAQDLSQVDHRKCLKEMNYPYEDCGSCETPNALHD